MAKKTKHTNHYKTLGINDFSNSDQVASAFARLQQHHANIGTPSAKDKQEWERIQEAFNVLFFENTKNDYDNKLSAYLNNQKPKTQAIATSDKSKFTNIALVVVGLLSTGAYFYHAKSTIANTPNSSQIVKPVERPQNQQLNKGPFIHPFLTNFAEESLRQRSATMYAGLLGSKEINETILYPQSLFSNAILKTPLDQDFPAFSGLLSDFPSYSYGDVKLVLFNPTSENAFIKILYLDEDENFVIRHAYILANDQLTLSGLPEGAIQVATLFPAYPQMAFLTQQFKLSYDVENNLPIFGQKIPPMELF